MATGAANLRLNVRTVESKFPDIFVQIRHARARIIFTQFGSKAGKIWSGS